MMEMKMIGKWETRWVQLLAEKWDANEAVDSEDLWDFPAAAKKVVM